MKSGIIPSAQGGLVWAHGVHGGSPVKILVDTDGHLQVDNLSNALPSGSATAAKQVTFLSSLKKRAGYTGIVREQKKDLSASADEDTLETTAVPANTVYVLDRITAWDQNNALTDLAIEINSSGSLFLLDWKLSLSAAQKVTIEKKILLGPAETIKAFFYGTVANDDIYLEILGHKWAIA